jgi:hypothetical protein
LGLDRIAKEHRMATRLFGVALLAGLLAAGSGWGDEKPAPKPDSDDDKTLEKGDENPAKPKKGDEGGKSAAKARKTDFGKIARLGPGVYKIKFDKIGRIQSAIVVGTSRISTVLGAAKGKEVARQRADLRANGEFVKWLKSKVSVHQKDEATTALFLEGREENDKQTMAESGKSIEKTSAKFETTAGGLVRGMEVAYFEVKGAQKTYYLVKRWTARGAKAGKEIDEGETKAKPKVKGKKKGGKGLEDESGGADD